jgi:hypothetical protein
MPAHHTLEAYLDVGGTLENAPARAAHESPKTITLNEIARIVM